LETRKFLLRLEILQDRLVFHCIAEDEWDRLRYFLVQAGYNNISADADTYTISVFDVPSDVFVMM